MPIPDSFDAIIVGTGQAGPPLARRLSAAGKKICIIERKRFGGTCVNTGCTPTKAMVASAYAAHMARRCAEYGVQNSGPITVDMKLVKARKDAIVRSSNEGLQKSLKSLDNCTVIEGHARFESCHQIRIGDRSITAPWIFLNPGARAITPRIAGVDTVDYLTNSSLLELETLPQHLVIIGGSYEGVEFGQMFRRFGSEVSIIEHGPRLASREDPDISQAILEILQSEAIRVHLGTKCTQLGMAADQIACTLESAGGSAELRASHVLFAIGRRPNTDDLGLEDAGISTDNHGYVVVDDELRTNVDGVWALGDCNARGAFTHTSYNDFEIVAANLLDGAQRRLTDRIPTYGIFIDPPLGRIGMTEAQVRASGRKALIGVMPMSRVSRAIEKGETKGLMKILVDAESHKILGAAILGTGGDEAIHCITDVMYAQAPYTVIQNAVHIHPTVAELIPTMLGQLKPLEESK